jgi:hypothetical protein
LQPGRVVAIVPPHLLTTEEYPRFRWGSRRLRLWVRLGLVLIVTGLVAVFAVAIVLNPFKDGRVWLQETHTQMGLPPCTFKVLTGLPCPSCGMTSSFALLMHGDPWNSVRANFVGTLLAIFCLVFIPWALASAICGRLLLVRSLEHVLVRLVLAFVVLLLVRWGFVVAWILLSENGSG